MSLAGLVKRKGPSGFGHDSTAEDVTAGLDLSGKTVLVTGCASGLGAETARVLCARGARVVATARTLERAREACARIPGQATPLECDLSEPDSVRSAAQRVSRLAPPLDAIVANAGVMALPTLQKRHGCELQLLTNHVGHHLLVTSLLARLSPDARVVVVSSSLHARAPAREILIEDPSLERDYDPWTAYGRSKLANLLFVRELVRRFPREGQTANALHPGVVRTGLQRNLSRAWQAVFAVFGPLFTKSVEQGAATQCYLAAHPGAAAARGRYFVDCGPATPSPAARDDARATRLWEETERFLDRRE